MRRRALGAAAVLAAVAAAAAVGATATGFLLLPRATPAGDQTYYGHVKKVTRKGSHYELRFDPAWYLSGLTASRAALEETGSSDVPNDHYIIEEGHRLLTFVLPRTARVTVLANDGSGISSVPITVAELSRIVNGGHHRKLFEPLQSGVWIHVHIDTVRSLDQQYAP